MAVTVQKQMLLLTVDTLTYPVTTTAVTKEMKAEIIPLKKELTIIEASDKTLEVLGTLKCSWWQGGTKLVEVVGIEGEGSKETLISMDLLNLSSRRIQAIVDDSW